jgi:hypothetical protein
MQVDIVLPLVINWVRVSHPSRVVGVFRPKCPVGSSYYIAFDQDGQVIPPIDAIIPSSNVNGVNPQLHNHILHCRESIRGAM